MTKPTTSDFLAAADGTYSGDPAGTSGLSLLTGINGAPVTATRPVDGFHGVAFETDAGQIIIGFEGTALGSLQTRPTFVQAQIAADEQIATGQNPSLYTDALRFTRRVEIAAAAQGISTDDIFVDGHSLGGAQAEYVAVKTGLGGDTFGAPGIPSVDINTGLESRLTNYVDYGDPVGNYSDDPNRIGNLLMGEGIERYGRATYVGQPSDAGALAVAGRLYGTSDVGSAAAAGIVINAVADYHLIEDYAADLGVALPGGSPGAGSSPTAADIKGAVSAILGSGAGGSAGGGIGSLLSDVGFDAPVASSAGEAFLGGGGHPHRHAG